MDTNKKYTGNYGALIGTGIALASAVREKKSGKKTYTVAAVALLGAAAAYFTGTSSLMDCLKIGIDAVLAATIRIGVAAK
jgi:hypothetical protein